MLKLLLQQQKIKRKKFPNPAENPLDNPPGPAGRLLLTRGFDILFRSLWKFDTLIVTAINLSIPTSYNKSGWNTFVCLNPILKKRAVIQVVEMC